MPHTTTTEPDTTEPRTPARTPGVIIGGYAALVYLFFLGVLGYAVGFFADRGVPRTVDDGPTASVPAAVAVDLLLLLLFAGQHTVMARPWFKRAWTRIVPAPAERATFVLAAGLVLALLYWQWRPIGPTVWHLHGLAAAALGLGYAAGWLLAVGSSYLIDHADLFGLRQAWARLRGMPYRPVPFCERGLYRHLRHPLMAGFLIVFWSASEMTVGHLLFAAASSGYVAVGIRFEERDLLRSLDAGYADYRARVPALLPRLRRPRNGPGTR